MQATAPLRRPAAADSDDDAPTLEALRRRRTRYFAGGTSDAEFETEGPRRSPRLRKAAGADHEERSEDVVASDSGSGGAAEEDDVSEDEIAVAPAADVPASDAAPHIDTGSSAGPAAEGGPSEPSPASPSEDKLCRICFGGVEEEPELGRLFSPCLCKGTMRYVHINCLNEWRRKGVRQESFYQCDQCKYRFAFRRTWWANVVMSEVTITLFTLFLFAVLVFLAGFLTKLLLLTYLYFNPTEIEGAPPAEPEDGVDFWDGLFIFDPTRLSLFRLDTTHFFAGFMLVGILGAFNFLISFLTGPLGPVPRFGVVRVGGGGQNGESKLSTVVMAVFIIVGAVRTLFAIYKSVKAFSRRSLEIVEASILEVH
ncbi:hypothetical protein DFJ74DRAFT_707807 [Hyaloraphidium curvatum]|nr:hypothetical protein DFJ74DRAFT_707807 [Hyaloraphidium curvatum]